MDHSARSMKAQFKFADKMGAKRVVLLGEDELQKGEVTIRDMKDGGEQISSLERLIECIKGEEKA